MANKIHWHPAFVQAIQADLAAYREHLIYTPELPLTTEPLRIDLMIIKKPKDIVIDNSIARFFRKDNLLEYKSPTDYLSIRDFSQVHAYAYLYASITQRVVLEDITLTFFENRCPRKFLNYLAKDHAFKIENPSPGIYLVQRKYLPLQIVVSRELPEEENIFLRALTNKLKADSLETILKAQEKLESAIRLDAYFNAVIQENPKAFLEVQNMARRSPTFEEVFTEAGIIPKWIEQGIEQAEEKFVRNLLKEGLSIETIARVAELSIEKVQAIAANGTLPGAKKS